MKRTTTHMDRVAPGVWNMDREVGDRRVKFRIEVGRQYRVHPLNPAKKKHRDRIVELVEIEDDLSPQDGWVRFQDNNRRGKVALNDLLPLEVATE